MRHGREVLHERDREIIYLEGVSPMTVTIQLVGVFRSGRFNDAVREYPAATRVREVVDELGIPAPLLGIVLINGIHAGIEDILSDGDTLCLLPFIDGG